MGLIISTDHLISASEARKKFAHLIDKVESNIQNYFIILENGKIAAMLVNPQIFYEKNTFPYLEILRKEWSRNSEKLSQALKNLKHKKNLPKFLQ